MGKKYIVEIGDNENLYKTMITNGGKSYMAVVHGEPYTAPDLEQVRKEAYDKGYEDAEEKYNDGYSDGYDAGLDDAWKAARKIGDMPYGEEEKAFGSGGWHFIEQHTASEAIAAIKKYEDGKQEIKVGDEVGYYGVADEHGNVNYRGIVLEIRKDDYLVMEKDGKTYQLKKKLVMSKTGRHYPEIAAVLEKMRGEQE